MEHSILDNVEYWIQEIFGNGAEDGDNRFNNTGNSKKSYQP